MPPLTLGEQLGRARHLAHLDQGHVGERIGVSRPTLSKWARDGSQPTITQFAALVRLYDADWLYDVVKDEPERRLREPTLTDRAARRPEVPSALVVGELQALSQRELVRRYQTARADLESTSGEEYQLRLDELLELHAESERRGLVISDPLPPHAT